MIKSVTYFVFVIILSAFILAGCQSGSDTEGLELRMKIDSAIAFIQPQTDTGYRTQYSQYKKSIDSLEIIAKEANYSNALGRIYFMVGSMNRWLNKYDTALVWLEKSYRQLKGTNTLEEIYVLLEIGDVYFNLGRKKLSNDYYYQALSISERIYTSDATAQTFLRLAVVYYQQSSYREALKMYYKTLNYARKTKYEGDHKTIEMRMFNNIGVCYSNLGIYDSALLYYDSALREAQRLDETPLTIAKGVFNGNKGRIFQLQGDFINATRLLNLNVAINATPNGDKKDAITSLTYLAEIYLELDSNEKFTTVSNKAIDYTFTFESNQVKKWRARVFGLKAQFYAKNNKADLAYFYRTRQFEIQDSLTRNEEKEHLQDIILYRQLKNSEQQLQVLQESSKSQQTRIYIYLTIVVLVVALLIIAIISLNSYRKNLARQKELNQQISEQNLQIVLSKKELEQAIEELTHLNAEKNKLLGMVAHDLRGPIYNITGVVQLLESSEQYSRFDDGALQLVDLIKKSCDNALSVINDLLDAAKLENGGLRGEMKAENLNEVIKDAIRLYQNRAGQKQIQIEFSKPESNVEIFISKEKINRAIGNLLSNAIKFSKPKSTVNVLLTKTENNIIITVSDSGIGIPQADREFIFDKFTKAKRPGTDGEKPVGLGMSIVKQIVEAHNGRIWFESEVGKGTTFYIELPLN